MKRYGHIYEKMADWDMIRAAQNVSIRNKGTNRGVCLHKRDWMKNLVEIQQHVINGTMRTGTYKHATLVSGQGKVRDIAKLDFHPSHIQHQLLVMAGMDVIEKSYIHDTYASRVGYGQHKGAMRLNKWVQKYSNDGGEFPVYLQLDICKYYDSIPHDLIEEELRRRFKDERYVEAMMEPIRVFAPEGRGIPLGIRPSQIFGNLALCRMDRMVKEELRCKCYIRYLDDMVLLCHNRGEAHRYAEAVERWLDGYGFKLHVPRIDKVRNGIDFFGYVCYPGKGMFWRTSNKKAWMKRRSNVTNKKRMREIDSAAWGFVKHGNKDCKKLYYKMNGIRFDKMVDRPVQKDRNGKRIIDGQVMSMQMVLDKPVEVVDVESGVVTAHGGGRVVMQVRVMGTIGKLIVNAPMKEFFVECWRKGVTKMETVFVDKGGKHYDFKEEDTRIIDVRGREICEIDGKIVYVDTNEIVEL